MADYHPLDVRYKGPSTAYRGSTKEKFSRVEYDKPTQAPTPSAKPATPPLPKPQAQAAEASPWGGKYKSQPKPPPASSQPRRTSVAARGIGGTVKVVSGVVTTVKYIYFAVIAIVFLIAFIL